MSRVDLAARMEWSEQELKQLTSSNRLAFEGRLVALDLWTRVQERVVIEGTLAYLELVAGAVTRRLSDLSWVGRGWCLMDRTLLRVSEEASEFSQPQAYSPEREKRWRRDWEVVGCYQPRRQPVLELLHLRGHLARGWLEDPMGRSALAGSADEADLLAVGFVRRGLQGDYGCEPDRVTEALELLLAAGWKVSFQGAPVLLQTGSRLELRDEGRLTGELVFADRTAAVAEAWKEQEASLCALPGGWGLLLQHALRSWVRNTQDGLQIPAGVIGTAATADVIVQVSAESWMQDSKPAYPAPSFRGTLRDYQLVGMRWILGLDARRGGGLLADQMGLGKTVQVLAAISQLSGPVLLVVPTTLLENWRREWHRFLPERPLRVHHGPSRLKDLTEAEGQLGDQECLLTTPGMVRQDAWLQQKEWRAVVVDEAQTLKNHEAQTTQAVQSLHARLRIALTGTPLENHPEELWTHLRFLDPQMAGERVAFLRLFSTEQGRRALKATWSGWMLRRLKQEVVHELPALMEQQVLLECHPEQWEVHERLRRFGELDHQHNALEEAGAERSSVLVRLMRLRQISCAPVLCGLDLPSPKLDQLAEDLMECAENGQQVLVFSQFTQLLSLACQRCKIPYGMITGKTSNRQAVVDAFQEGLTTVLFCSLKAAGIGLNLQKADVVILLDPWWNRAAEQQAIDRAHRLGRQGSVLVKRYIMAGSIEEKVAKLQSVKQGWMEAWWGTEEDGQTIEQAPNGWESLLEDDSL